MKRQFAWVAGGRILAALLQAAILVALARATTPSTFGLFSAVFGIGVVVQNAFDLGLGTFIVRQRAKAPDSPLVRRALALSNITSVTMGVFAAAVLVILDVASLLPFLSFVPLAIAMAAERNADVRLGVALADGDAHVNTINLVGRRMLALIVFLIAIGAGDLDPVLSYGSAAALSGLLSATAAHSYVRTHVQPVAEVVSFRVTLQAAWPFYVNSFTTQLRNLDSTMVTAVTGPVQGGLYAAAARLTGPLRILPTSLAAVVLPRASHVRGPAEKRQGMAMTIKVVAAMAVLYALCAAAAPTGIPLVLGAPYAGSIPAVQIVLSGLVFAAAASLLSASLQGWDDAHYVGAISTVTSVACLIAITIGASLGGATGAAWGLTFSFALQVGLLALRLPRHLRPSDPLQKVTP